MGLSAFHLVETRTQYIGIWLLVTCLRTLTSSAVTTITLCVCCVSHLLLGETSIDFSRCSFIIHSLTTSFPFLSTGLSPGTKSPKYTKKKLKTTENPYLL
jgi:hypothetical protein